MVAGTTTKRTPEKIKHVCYSFLIMHCFPFYHNSSCCFHSSEENGVKFIIKADKSLGKNIFFLAM